MECLDHIQLRKEKVASIPGDGWPRFLLSASQHSSNLESFWVQPLHQKYNQDEIINLKFFPS